MSSDSTPERPEETEVSFDEVRARLGDPARLIVNVLSAEAFALARIPGSVHLPLPAIAETALRVLPDRDADVVVYCGGPT